MDLIPNISQETLTEMVGAAHVPARLFMSGVCNLGFTENKDRIRDHKSLLNVVLHDQISERDANALPCGSARAHSISKADYQLR
jgi:CRP/FNR family cyclic AMP-dependent transcriptional regulator